MEKTEILKIDYEENINENANGCSRKHEYQVNIRIDNRNFFFMNQTKKNCIFYCKNSLKILHNYLALFESKINSHNS